MAEHSTLQAPAGVGVPAYVGAVFLRETMIATIAFLTVVDLFATQAILPSLARHYQVSPAAMGFAVNASTIGMAVSGLFVAMFARRIDRRRGIIASLVLLVIPTALLAVAPGLPTFTALRIVQGIFMASAFTLTLAYLGDEYRANAAAGAFAAYITGNVASNLIGRLVSAALVDHLGLAANFHVFALLNLAGAVLVMLTLHRVPKMRAPAPQTAALTTHLRDTSLRAAFGIGFCILFAFIGTFTFVNFALIRAPLFLSPMQLGFVYLVFLPSVLTTPLAGLAVQRLGLKPALWSGLGAAGLGVPLLATSNLAAVLAGMVLMGVGTFFAQATATGYVGRAAMADRGSASGLYLASYFSGGIVGSAVLGQVFDRFGWNACLAGIALALAAGALLATRLRG